MSATVWGGPSGSTVFSRALLHHQIRVQFASQFFCHRGQRENVIVWITASFCLCLLLMWNFNPRNLDRIGHRLELGLPCCRSSVILYSISKSVSCMQFQAGEEKWSHNTYLWSALRRDELLYFLQFFLAQSSLDVQYLHGLLHDCIGFCILVHSCERVRHECNIEIQTHDCWHR